MIRKIQFLLPVLNLVFCCSTESFSMQQQTSIDWLRREVDDVRVRCENLTFYRNNLACELQEIHENLVAIETSQRQPSIDGMNSFFQRIEQIRANATRMRDKVLKPLLEQRINSLHTIALIFFEELLNNNNDLSLLLGEITDLQRILETECGEYEGLIRRGFFCQRRIEEIIDIVRGQQGQEATSQARETASQGQGTTSQNREATTTTVSRNDAPESPVASTSEREATLPSQETTAPESPVASTVERVEGAPPPEITSGSRNDAPEPQAMLSTEQLRERVAGIQPLTNSQRVQEAKSQAQETMLQGQGTTSQNREATITTVSRNDAPEPQAMSSIGRLRERVAGMQFLGTSGCDGGLFTRLANLLGAEGSDLDSEQDQHLHDD